MLDLAAGQVRVSELAGSVAGGHGAIANPTYAVHGAVGASSRTKTALPPVATSRASLAARFAAAAHAPRSPNVKNEGDAAKSLTPGDPRQPSWSPGFVGPRNQ